MRLTGENFLNVALVAGTAALIFTSDYNGKNPGIDPTTTASIGSADGARAATRFTVIDHTLGNTCVLSVTYADGYDVHMVKPSADCDTISPRLADARAWQDKAQGNVTLADRSGTPLVRLAPSDGFAFEVVEPANLRVSFAAY